MNDLSCLKPYSSPVHCIHCIRDSYNIWWPIIERKRLKGQESCHFSCDERFCISCMVLLKAFLRKKQTLISSYVNCNQ